ncbi:MAG: hypothetical protein P8106_04125 [Gammaproteobacteria bacterium]
MLRFLAGIVLIQATTVLLVLVAGRDAADLASWLPVLIALGMIALIAAFWFATVAAHRNQAELERQRADFAREREQFKVAAEREKTRLVRQSHKTLTKQTRRVESRANMKVGAAVAGAAGIGLLMVVTNFVTLGLLTLTGAGAALGGYLLRRRWFDGPTDGPPRLPRRMTALLPRRRSRGPGE